jgi:Ca2+/Na+ antiporter
LSRRAALDAARRRKSRERALFDTIFAFLHMGGLLVAVAYAVMSLIKGNISRFALILALLAVYYLFILHPAVKKEINRRKSLKK